MPEMKAREPLAYYLAVLAWISLLAQCFIQDSKVKR